MIVASVAMLFSFFILIVLIYKKDAQKSTYVRELLKTHHQDLTLPAFAAKVAKTDGICLTLSLFFPFSFPLAPLSPLF